MCSSTPVHCEQQHLMVQWLTVYCRRHGCKYVDDCCWSTDNIIGIFLLEPWQRECDGGGNALRHWIFQYLLSKSKTVLNPVDQAWCCLFPATRPRQRKKSNCSSNWIISAIFHGFRAKFTKKIHFFLNTEWSGMMNVHRTNARAAHKINIMCIDDDVHATKFDTITRWCTASMPAIWSSLISHEMCRCATCRYLEWAAR